MRDKRGGTSHGFTLLEVVICLGLIATVLLAVFGVQAKSIDLQEEAMFIRRASLLARETLTIMRAEDTLLTGAFSGYFEKQDASFRVEAEVNPLPHINDFYKIDMKISIEGQKNTKEYRTAAYLHRAPP